MLPKLVGGCRGMSPHVSSAANEGFLFDVADSIELKLEVRPCLWFCESPLLVDLCLGGFGALGGSIETAFGRLSGRIICEAPFRYDKCRLKPSFVGDCARNIGAACRKGIGEGLCKGGEGSGGTGGISSSSVPSARKN
jgi:hypothetical protein